MKNTEYDFQTVIERKNTNCLKWDLFDDDLPMWVADMDFRVAPAIENAIMQRANHPIYGYTVVHDELFEAYINWWDRRYGLKMQREDMAYSIGVMPSISSMIRCLTDVGDEILIQTPVYHPFRLTPEGNGRKVVYNPLKETDGSYEIDFEQLAQVADDKCRLLILSNPHNPAGICWDVDTLRRLAKFCYERNIIVISDEIHSDMAIFGHKHVPFASVSDEAAQISITFGAPSKTFNIAGIVSSYAIVPNDTLRRRFYTWLEANELNDPPLFAPIATIAAYQQGEEWRRQMLSYVEENVLFVEDYCRDYLPGIKPWRPQASFLVWLDCRGLGLTHNELIHLFVDKAHLALNDGAMFFGDPRHADDRNNFMRLNVAAPRSVLKTALEQLKSALK